MSSPLLRKTIVTGLLAVLMVALLIGCAQAPAPAPTSPAPAAPTAAPAQATNTTAPAPTSAPAPTNPPAPTAAPQAAGKNLIIGVSADIAGWDPTSSIYWLANEVIINTHDTLVTFAPTKDAEGNAVHDVSKIVPLLAESFDSSTDGKTFTFHLRKNAKFANGDPVTAEAAKASFARILTIPSLAQFLLHDVAFVTSPDMMVAKDPNTLVFSLDKPNPIFLKVMTEMNMAIVNVNQIQKEGGSDPKTQGDWAAAHPTGTGPYVVDNFQPGVQLVLKANPNYWGTPPFYSTVTYKIVPQAENRLLLLKNGDIDVAYEIALKDFASLKDTPGLTPYATPTFGTTFLVAGRNFKPWDNVKVRQAIAYAIPYDTIIKEVTYGFAKPAPSWVPAGLEGFVPASPYKYDLNKAKELLAAAGYPDGKGLPTLPFALKQGVPEEEASAVYIQAELKKIGINMEIQPLALAAHSEKLSKHQLVFTFNFWIPYVPDPVYNLYWNYKTADTGCCNYQSYSNKQVDDLIEKGLVELDPVKRLDYVKQVQEIVAQDPPQLPLYHPTWNLAMKSGISGYSYYPDTLLRFVEMSGK